MRIHIEELRFDAIIGILDFERTVTQQLIVDILIDYAFDGQFINYADVSTSTKRHLQEGQFLLLEDALLSLSKELKSQFSAIQNLSIKITKPSILPDCKVSLSDSFVFQS